MSQKYNLITLLGATATGKTGLGVKIAQQLKSEIISADSRQVYIGMDIGTGKDLTEYQNTPYHLIDILSPHEEFNAYQFQKQFFEVFSDIKNHLISPPLLVGGTGLYLDTILNSYKFQDIPINNDLRNKLQDLSDEQLIQKLKAAKANLHNTTDITNRDRMVRAIEITEFEQSSDVIENDFPEISSLVLGIHFEREQLKKRITLRLKQRLKNGMIEEVEELYKQGISHEKLEFFGLEYKHISLFLQKKIKSRNDLFQKLNSSIHQFAKRQATWFRKMEKNGTKIWWLDGNKDVYEQANTVINQNL